MQIPMARPGVRVEPVWEGDEVRWNRSTLDAGESWTIQINALVVAGTADGTVIRAPVQVIAVGAPDTISVERSVAVVNVSNVPNITGIYNGTVNQIVTNCQNPIFDGSFQFPKTVEFANQNGTTFSGTDTHSTQILGVTFEANSTFSGNVNVDGSFNSLTCTFTETADGAFDNSGTCAFMGNLVGDDISIQFTSQATTGDTCQTSGTFNGNR